MLDRLAWFPVPLLAAVVFVIAATQVNLVLASLGVLGRLLLVFVGYLVAAALAACALSAVFALPSSQGRVLAFSMGTRTHSLSFHLLLRCRPHMSWRQ